jgi:hypothetical protein
VSCCWFGRRRIISGSAEITAIRALQRCRSMAKLRHITLAEDPGSTRPERHFPSGAAQTRIVSVARIRLDPRKSVRPFKGIICGDISEFESRVSVNPGRFRLAIHARKRRRSALRSGSRPTSPLSDTRSRTILAWRRRPVLRTQGRSHGVTEQEILCEVQAAKAGQGALGYPPSRPTC